MAKRNSLLKYAITRLTLMPIMLWIIATMVFLLLRIAPGDPVDAVLGSRANEIARAAMRSKLGLDKPLIEQYISFLNNLIHGNLGEALINQQPVTQIISKALPATIELSFCALIIAVISGLFIGLSGAAKPDGRVDFIGRLYGISTYALPPFWIAMLVQIFFAVILGWLPVGGRFPSNLNELNGSGFLIIDSILAHDLIAFKGAIRHLILPSFTLGILLSGIFSRTLRLNLSRILKSDHIEASKSRGLNTKRLLINHAIPNSLLPVLTIAGITVASLIGGALLIEITFSWPGIAVRLQEAINQRDYPVVQGIVLVISSIVVIVSIIVDLIVACIDPRISY